MRKSYQVLSVIAVIIILVPLAYLGIKLEQKKTEAYMDEYIESQHRVDDTVKDLSNIIKRLEKNIAELESKLTDQSQEMDKIKEHYEETIKKQEAEIDHLRKLTIVSMEATAYTAFCEGCSGITYTGLDVRKSTPKIIAVDPKVIPLHSKVELIVGGQSWGTYTASDIGSAIKGHRIDILMSDKKTALKFGRQEVSVRMIRKGPEPI